MPFPAVQLSRTERPRRDWNKRTRCAAPSLSHRVYAHCHPVVQNFSWNIAAGGERGLAFHGRPRRSSGYSSRDGSGEYRRARRCASARKDAGVYSTGNQTQRDEHRDRATRVCVGGGADRAEITISISTRRQTALVCLVMPKHVHEEIAKRKSPTSCPYRNRCFILRCSANGAGFLSRGNSL